MSQGDALMKRKMENLVQRHQSVGSLHPARTFCFTEQISPARVREGDENSPVPDNWVEPKTGGYFATRSGPAASQAPAPKAGHGTTSPSLPTIYHHRVTPAQRQAELDQKVRDCVINALEEQRAAEDARLNACKAQRDIEIVKFHQLMKSRTELQMKSNQFILGHSVAEMGLDHLLGATNASTTTRAAAERDEHRGDAQRQFLDFNRDRLEHNLLHRQYCLDAHKERQRFRQGLEAHVGTLYSKSKTSLLNDVGVGGAEATFATKTIHELREDKAKYHAARRSQAQQDEEVHLLVNDVTTADERLWNERRKVKGQPTVRTREVEYSVDAPYRRRAQSTEP
jgi:hypothetical protein